MYKSLIFIAFYFMPIVCQGQSFKRVTQISEIKGFNEDINSIQFISKDCSSFICATGSVTASIFQSDKVQAELSVWNSLNGLLVTRLYNGNVPIEHVAVSPDLSLLASINTNKEIVFYNLPTLKESKRISAPAIVGDITFTPDNLFLVVDFPIAKAVAIYDVASGDMISYFETDQEIDAIAVSPSFITVVTRNKKLQIWSIISNTLVKEIDISLCDGAQAIIYSHDYSQIIIGGRNGDILVLNSETLSIEKTLKGHFNKIQTIALSTDNKLLLSGSWDMMIKVWNLEKDNEITTINNVHKGIISSMAFCPSSTIFITSGDDKVVRVWKIR